MTQHNSGCLILSLQVRFFYSFTSTDHLYLVMEYLNGGDLYSLLQKVGCLEEDVARIYISELVRQINPVDKFLNPNWDAFRSLQLSNPNWDAFRSLHWNTFILWELCIVI